MPEQLPDGLRAALPFSFPSAKYPMGEPHLVDILLNLRLRQYRQGFLPILWMSLHPILETGHFPLSCRFFQGFD